MLGLLVLVGIHETNDASDAEYICRKVLNWCLFPNEKTRKTRDPNNYANNYELLLVRQFTLYGIFKGNKPDFRVAVPMDAAKPFYAVVENFQKAYKVDTVKGDRLMPLTIYI
ncbi:d-tyrosyl-tRNA(tyr) deacylase [Phtheirospermum japonicum]|uniref:D-aminoacyl-tRNA deacylase n=1 Tax=Phtheirospermum japonicum TaxID=374723 RepID=A0A830D279_9LAMI|nr:d-tyrosyl-tRNA(tyr) deacylase [Phtheirospermum japonicum]